jgi:glycosyltransferase involved in cell wall biosynthesis
MMPRLGIDARAALAPQPTGVERVVRELLAALGRRRAPRLEVFLFVHEEPEGRLPEPTPGPVVVVPRVARAAHALADLWIALQMRAAFRAHTLDAFLSPNTKQPLTRRPCFTMVHGLEWARTPRDYTRVERLKQRLWLRLSTHLGAGIVTFARHTADDLARELPNAHPPVRVLSEGVGAAFRPIAPADRDLHAVERLGVRLPYVLSVCSHEPRKNLPTLLRAFARARAEHALPHRLVLAGRPGRCSASIAALANELGIARDVVLPGYVGEHELVQLYNHAELFCYPSRYEGFGLPPLEAMRCGVPVVTSDRSATREVAGDAALLVDPDSAPALAAAIGRALTDADLRARLVRAGHARAAEFSWDVLAADIEEFVVEQLPQARSGER